MDLPELLQHIADEWPRRFERGLVTHIHANDLETADGSLVHLRVLIQARPAESRIDRFKTRLEHLEGSADE